MAVATHISNGDEVPADHMSVDGLRSNATPNDRFPGGLSERRMTFLGRLATDSPLQNGPSAAGNFMNVADERI